MAAAHCSAAASAAHPCAPTDVRRRFEPDSAVVSKPPLPRAVDAATTDAAVGRAPPSCSLGARDCGGVCGGGDCEGGAAVGGASGSADVVAGCGMPAGGGCGGRAGAAPAAALAFSSSRRMRSPMHFWIAVMRASTASMRGRALGSARKQSVMMALYSASSSSGGSTASGSARRSLRAAAAAGATRRAAAGERDGAAGTRT